MEQNTEVLELKENTSGISNEGFVKENSVKGMQSNVENLKMADELSPLTYKDFIPDCLGSIAGKVQSFADFGSVLEQANKWLLTVPQFTVFKCETISVKMDADQKPNNDQTLTHFSSNGKKFLFENSKFFQSWLCLLHAWHSCKCLKQRESCMINGRMSDGPVWPVLNPLEIKINQIWLIPKTDPNIPVQQIAYITALPDHDEVSLTGFLHSLTGSATSKSVGDIISSFDNLKTTVDKLNNHLQVRPLPGQILSFETLTFKCHEAGTLDKFDAESSFWSEGGANMRVYVHGFRIFYTRGQPAHETIGVHDEEPDMTQSSDGLGLGVKFGTFDHTLNKASQWLQKQEGIRVISIHNVDVKLERKHSSGPWILDSSAPAYTESQSLSETRFTKVLRIAYIKDTKPNSLSTYPGINMTSKIFVPARIEGKKFETFSKTVLRVIEWLQIVRMPIFMCETLNYHVSAGSKRQGFNDQRPDYLINTFYGQHYLTCIRLYFPTTYQDVQQWKPLKNESAGGQSCSIS